MFIYIDESGSFVPPKTPKQTISVVGALLIPDVFREKLFNEYKKIRGKKKEIKGNTLEEIKLTEVLLLLNRFDLAFIYCPIDLSNHTCRDIEKHRDLQANKLLDNVKDEFPLDYKNYMLQLKDRLSKLPAQLYAQLILNTFLIEAIINNGINYYCQRFPKSLSHFKFIIDRKDKKIKTEYEKLWTTMVKPLLQSQSITKPFVRVHEFDYSYFSKFHYAKNEGPTYLQELYGIPQKESINLNLFLENMKFLASEESCGLQLVDILVNAMRKALLGKLNKENLIRLSLTTIQQIDNKFTIYTFGDKNPNEDTNEFGSAIVKYSKRMLKN
jgi:hypothetical protein